MRRKKKGVMDKILVFLAIFLFLFTIGMIVLYIFTGSTPDTLITCVFAISGGECGILGWIKTTKERQQERKWEMEDRKKGVVKKDE